MRATPALLSIFLILSAQCQLFEYPQKCKLLFCSFGEIGLLLLKDRHNVQYEQKMSAIKDDIEVYCGGAFLDDMIKSMCPVQYEREESLEKKMRKYPEMFDNLKQELEEAAYNLLTCMSSSCHPSSLPEIMVTKAVKVLRLSDEQQANARAIMEECVKLTTDKKQLAYILSTAYGESVFKPIKEIRAKEGTSTWNSQKKYWYTGYYGRGYVQLTGLENYQKFGKLLGIDLVNNPDKALDHQVACKIICIGMTKGLFGKGGLDKYLSEDGLDDWTNARRIINGVERAEIFGNRGQQIYNA